MIHIPKEFLSDSQMIFYKKNRKFVLFTVIDELLTLVVQKCHLFKTKAKKRHFLENKCTVDNFDFLFFTLTPTRVCRWGEGNGAKIWRKGQPIQAEN